MLGKKKQRRTVTEEQFSEIQKKKAQVAALVRSKKITYLGKIYRGWDNLFNETGISKHMFIKYKMGEVN